MVRKEYDHKATLVDGLPVLYCKFGKNKPWVNITKKRFSITLLSLLDSNNRMHSISECEITINELVVKILLNFDVSQILFKNEIIWKFYYCFWSGYPKYIQFDLVKNKFTLVFDHGIERKLETMYTLVGRECGGTLEIDKYESKGSLLRSFIFKEKFNVIGNGVDDVWERLPGEPYPKRMMIDDETNEIVIFCEDRYFVVRREHGTISRDQHELTQLHKDILNLFDRKHILD
ncbi:hypothetical protein TpMuguga_03g00080 [Theileria parva strain Muguga]|uniref:Uncharacterized protein n=1 Tax=Theileria parva TaxID=5875 RepID=Q4N0N6_THEPA|nr:uncharacterized protein TpMuguga_03g00080 [Theileria parva strain Muguga]EAN30816.1 hypothetical protein TpMuguga_03g00080 [Theileria parva strain Muguga]|eukprot:XP_763099.1 hypothetical protein [Theileria parva strain Muguga]